MNGVDTIDAAAAVAANSLTAFTIFITFTFGYLATTYFVGAKLTRFQAFAATGLCIVAAGFMAAAMLAWLDALFAIMREESTVLNGVFLLQEGYWYVGISTLLGLGMVVSLYFMWDIRHRNA